MLTFLKTLVITVLSLLGIFAAEDGRNTNCTAGTHCI